MANKISFLVLCVLLMSMLLFWYVKIIPKPKEIPQPVIEKVLAGEIALSSVYKDPQLFKVIYEVLGDETLIGVKFQTLSRRFYPIVKKDSNGIKTTIYYTRNDWALAMLEFMPVKDVAGADKDWQLEASKLMYQSKLKPVYGLQDMSYEKNEELIVKWQILLKKIIDQKAG